MTPRHMQRTRQRLDESRHALEEFKYALDQAAIVAITDQRGVITYVNDKFCEISKYTRGELLGQDHRIVSSGYHPPAFIRELWRTIARGRVWRGELRNRARDGAIYWVDTTIVPLLDEAGKPRQYLSIRSDITQRKLAEAALREQAALIELGKLAAIVAHEVRNPLAGVKGALQVIAGRMPADSQDRAIVSVMLERLDALGARVNDILLYAGTTPPRLQAVSVHTLCADVIGLAQASLAGVTMTVSGEDAAVRADPQMLRDALLNLVLNAGQASPPGGEVEIAASAAPEGVQLRVLDRGPGIPAAARARVFEPFFTTRRGGTGLGLAIVRRLVERQGGAAVLEDRDGGGTIAVITLPPARA